MYSYEMLEHDQECLRPIHADILKKESRRRNQGRLAESDVQKIWALRLWATFHSQNNNPYFAPDERFLRGRSRSRSRSRSYERSRHRRLTSPLSLFLTYLDMVWHTPVHWPHLKYVYLHLPVAHLFAHTFKATFSFTLTVL